MKRHPGSSSLLIVLILVLGFLLAGCGVPQADYDAAVARADGLTADKASLETQVSSLMAEKAALEADKTGLQSQVDSLTADKTALQSDKTNIEADKTALQADKTRLTADLADLQDEYDDANDDLAALREVYPPRQFSSRSQLQSWLNANTVSDQPETLYITDWYTRALQVQRDALLDGYIISADYDYDATADAYYIYCTTVINGTIYFWDPESDLIYEDTDLVSIDTPPTV